MGSLEYDSFLVDSLMYIATNVLLVFALIFAPDPMMGSWKADLNASVLPAGFPQLRSQTMVLQLVSGKLRCSTERVSLNGTKTSADFIAAFDGKRYPVKGMAEIATVSLRRYPSFIEADFFSAIAPVYSYRMSISSKDDTLIVISIDPSTRATLHARIVYRREQKPLTTKDTKEHKVIGESTTERQAYRGLTRTNADQRNVESAGIAFVLLPVLCGQRAPSLSLAM